MEVAEGLGKIKVGVIVKLPKKQERAEQDKGNEMATKENNGFVRWYHLVSAFLVLLAIFCSLLGWSATQAIGIEERSRNRDEDIKTCLNENIMEMKGDIREIKTILKIREQGI